MQLGYIVISYVMININELPLRVVIHIVLMTTNAIYKVNITSKV